MPIPLIVFGDGPRIPSGLARIARDLTARLVAEQDDLGIRVVQVGIDPPGGWQWQSWDFYGFQESLRGYGRQELREVCTELERETGQHPIVLAITDPARLYDITREPLNEQDDTPRMDLWGYLPIDAYNVSGAIGGPAAEAIKTMDRVLAYGPYGANVLKRTLGTPVSHLPHGIEPIFHPAYVAADADAAWGRWYAAQPEQAIIVGCVATNQPRKDLGLLFASTAELKRRGRQVGLWLHTDLLTKAWDVGQLAHDFCFRQEEVFVSTTFNHGELLDQQLAARYACSTVTIAPGLGEGFGYPIVESLSCGTPVIHGNYGGGVDLIPNPAWLVEPVAYRLESCYALQRPVFKPEHVADTLEKIAFTWPQSDRQTLRAYCAGSVAHLHWREIWPRWRSWVQKGLEARRG